MEISKRMVVSLVLLIVFLGVGYFSGKRAADGWWKMKLIGCDLHDISVHDCVSTYGDYSEMIHTVHVISVKVIKSNGDSTYLNCFRRDNCWLTLPDERVIVDVDK